MPKESAFCVTRTDRIAVFYTKAAFELSVFELLISSFFVCVNTVLGLYCLSRLLWVVPSSSGGTIVAVNLDGTDRQTILSQQSGSLRDLVADPVTRRYIQQKQFLT